MREFKSGFVTLIGRPNVGKSTLMNHLVGEKLAIISRKPQTTRNKITTILTKDDFQAVFIDTPGLHTPKSKLGEFMVKSAENTLNEVDVVLYLVEPYENINENDRNIIDRLNKVKTDVFLVINKVDTVEKTKVLEVIDAYSELYNFKEIIPISAATGNNVVVLGSVLCLAVCLCACVLVCVWGKEGGRDASQGTLLKISNPSIRIFFS